MFKVILSCAILAVANAGPADYTAKSTVSFNGHHNSVNHIHSAAHSRPQYIASAQPKYYSAPVAPAPASSQFSGLGHYSSSSFTQQNPQSTPIVAVPVETKPVQVHYSTAPAISKYPEPTKYAAYEKEEQYGPAKYEFAYGVQDPHTGDFHSQEEKAEGGHVVGQYSLHEADGTIRIVKYSDDGHGFNAVVERQGHPTQPSVAYKNDVPQASPQYPHHY